MKLSRLPVVCLPILLVACAQLPSGKKAVEPPPAAPAAPVVASAVPAATAPVEVLAPPAPPELILPNVSLDGRMMFEFLLADIAAQRGNFNLASQAYFELARDTRDPRIAKRAAQLALEAHQLQRSVEAFKLWQELEPTALLAKQMLVTLLLSGGKWDEARQVIDVWLNESPQAADSVFMLLYSWVARAPDKAGILAWMQDIAQHYPKVAEAHWVVGQLALQSNNKPLALREAQQARRLRGDWDKAVLFEAKLLLPTETMQALDLLNKFLIGAPKNKEVRLFYARALLEQKDYAAARVQFRQFLTDYPDSSEIAYAIALLSLQLGELDRAEQELQAALNLGSKDTDTVHYYLGQLNEEKKKDELALTHYRQVTDGEHLFAARLREAYLLNKAGKLGEARAVLKAIPVVNNQQRVTAVIVEAQMLRDANNNPEYYQVVSDATDKLPNHPQLLFELAMAADKLGKLDIFEKTLRKLIQLDPDNAHAYNALGYSFLERNVQLEEGVQLVEKALQLAPDDAAIMDSVGWGYYRVGKLPQSIELLKRALAANPDPEIAAHLGEALWAKGDQTEAKKIWGEALKAHPDNTLLQAVIKKFIP